MIASRRSALLRTALGTACLLVSAETGAQTCEDLEEVASKAYGRGYADGYRDAAARTSGMEILPGLVAQLGPGGTTGYTGPGQPLTRRTPPAPVPAQTLIEMLRDWAALDAMEDLHQKKLPNADRLILPRSSTGEQ